MKTPKTILALLFLALAIAASRAQPTVDFTWPANGQVVTNLSALGGTVVDNSGLAVSVVFNVHEVDINGGPGRWWNGTNFQGSAASLPATVSGANWSPAAGLALPALNSGQSYQLTATASDTSSSASASITVQAPMTVLTWDPGRTPLGTAILPAPNTNGGSYWFEITPQSPTNGVWRTALNVLAGQAGVYLREGSPPTIYNYNFASANPGSNGFVVDASQFQPLSGQTWYMLVQGSAGAQWTLVTGDIYVYNLGVLATGNSSSTNAAIGAEGMIFYQTTIPSTTLAWQLWLNGAGNTMYVKKSAAPDAVSHDLAQAGQMLVVPPYLAGGTVNGSYFIGVPGNPGTAINLDSRQQPVTPLPFGSLTNVVVTATNFPYVTYEVQVPVQQIAWQLNLAPTSGNPSIAVRRDSAPNEFRNDAFSETPQNVGASVTLVPPPAQSGAGTPGLSDGTWYVTIYSTNAYACAFTNASPVVTPESYVFQAANDVPNRAGWRYYVLTNIDQQLGSLGWQLSLANQAPGTEIALRRNAVPGQWNQRTADDNYSVTEQGYVDLSSIYGLLQQPGHQADIWYIGVYTANQALGGFVLTGSQLTGQPMAFDGTGSSVAVANQPPGQWGFFQIIVPADPNLLGWDIRLASVANGNPQMVVSLDTLPTGFTTSYPWGSFAATNWPSGDQWLAGADWTQCGGGPMLEMGMGNPLQPGTYYIGVQDPNNASSYTLLSRGIGTNYAIAVRDLDFAAGSVTNLALPVGQADYYRVVVPSNAPDWKLSMSAVTGDAVLKVQRDYLPGSGTGGYDGADGGVYGGRGGQLMEKPGDEQWALLPYYASLYGPNLVPGTYYVLVASQGQNLVNNCEGSGSASYTLSSWTEPPTVLPGVLSYGNDLLWTNSQQGGAMEFYQFTVPAGIWSLEVELENRVGNPVMSLNAGSALVEADEYTASFYGNYGGTNAHWFDASLITIPNPQAGVYSLSVYAAEADDGSGTYPDAAYVLQVQAVPPQVTQVAFDGGTMAVANQPPAQWEFFRITVPSDANLLGWDIRLVGVTNRSLEMVVSRDTLPTPLGTIPYSGWPYGATNWPSGQWEAGRDWTGCGGGPMLEMGMGNPLQPGTYYIGVEDSYDTNSYTLLSRGIGTNYTIGVRDLDFATGSVTNSALAVGQADYYRVVVPSDAPDWKLHLGAVAGDAVLKVQQDYLPFSAPSANSADAPYGAPYGGGGGQLVMKPGDEQWALLPLLPGSGNTRVTAGTYYVLVASQGQNLTNGCEGSGSASYTLSSWTEPPTVLPGTLGYGQDQDLLWTNTQPGGSMEFYQFTVPAGIASIVVRLESRVGNPVMLLNTGSALVGTLGLQSYTYGSSYPYGNYGGAYWQWSDGSLITVPNPQPGAYSLSVYGADDGSGTYPDAGYVLQVQAAPPPLVAFNGGTAIVTNQPPGRWAFFQINVPADTNLLGWDIRLVGVTNRSLGMVVSLDSLPTSLDTTPYWFPYPYEATNWPSGYQWAAGRDWTGCAGGPMLEMGIGNPLQPGTYYIGVEDPYNTNGYSLLSRGIGLGTNYIIPVRTLGFIEGLTLVGQAATNLALTVGQADYYQVVVPSNSVNRQIERPILVPDWKLQLHMVTGDALLKIQRNYLPNSGTGGYDGAYGGVYGGRGGQLMEKSGDEQWALLPYYDSTGTTNLLPGTYYVLVGSQGQNLTNYCEGSGSVSYTLTNWVELPTVLPGPLGYGQDLLWTNAQPGGSMEFYQFIVPAGISLIEVRLENRVGNPTMLLNGGPALVGATGYYGNYGGTNSQWTGESLITIPNVQPGAYSLSVYGAPDESGAYPYPYPDASYVLRVRAPVVAPLSFSPELNVSGLTNVVSGTLADKENDYYQVTVPASVNGAPVLGWELELTALSGSPSVAVRQNLLPFYYGGGYTGGAVDTCDTTAFASPNAIIVPPFLEPGTWYVDVLGSGSTTYTLTSKVITTNTLAHPLWTMPQVGQTNTAPGLALPLIGDSGVNTNGTLLPGDQGLDLTQGSYDYYAVIVPTNNTGLLRTELQAISGNPNLYLRAGAAPTLNHYAHGSCDGYDVLIDRKLTGSTTEYGNWVPLNGRYESQLTNGLWVLAVQAAGNANVRYRLQLSCGNPVTNGLVQDLALNGGSFTNQNLDGGDWRYYRVQLPDPAPANWAVTFSRTLGGAIMFVRDTIPPGDGSYASDFSNPADNPGPGSPDLQTWNSDDKNEGPYPRFDTPGTYNLTTPPLRPGSVYYLGFWSPVDTTFSLNSATNGGAINVTNTLAFYGGSITGNIPGHGASLYRIDVPSDATRILFNASNSTDVVLALEQGTIALAGGLAHWTSYWDNNSQDGNQANASLDQFLPAYNSPLRPPYSYDWPWLPGYSYYLAITNTSAAAEHFSVTMGVPADLAPVSLLAPPTVTSVAPSPSIVVVWGVTNRGPAATSGYWFDTVWFSTNGVLDANSIAIGSASFYTQTVPVGGTYWQTNLVTLPMSASGNYTLFVQVDADNSIYEANVGDKVSAPANGEFTLAAPDLVPVWVIAPATVIAAQPKPAIQVAWGVTNQGIGAATGGWYDRVWFSTNGVLDARSADLGDFYFNQVMPPGGSYWRTNSVTLPMTNSGNYTLFVQVDVYNSFYESDTANSVSAPVPGTFILQPPVPPGFQTVVKSGSTVSFTWSAAAGQKYQVQYMTELGQGTWLDLGNPVTAAGSSASFSDPDPTTADRQRFYRIVLLP